MNSTIEAVNSAADTWWPYVLHICWQATLVATIVLAIVRFGSRLPSGLRSALILIAFAKFLLPPVLPLPMGVFSQLDFEEPGTVAAEEREPASFEIASLADPVSPHGIDVAEDRSITDDPTDMEPETSTVLPSDSPRSSSNPSTSSTVPATSLANALTPPRLSWRSWLMLLHGLGTLSMTGWIILTAIRLLRLKRRATVVDAGRVHEIFISTVRELGIRRTVGLRVAEHDVPPMAFGVFRPTVILPTALLDELNDDELKTICAHELAHHKRRDPLMNFLQVMILAVWWFHPLLWLLNRTARDIREDCCDDLILSRRLTTASIYCQMLVRMAERISQRPRLLGCAEQMHPVKARMLRVMDTTLSRTPRLSLRGLLAVVIVACLLLPGMKGLSGGSDETEQRSERSDTTESTQAKVVRRDLQGEPLPAGALVRLGTMRYRHNVWAMHYGAEFLSDTIYVSYENYVNIENSQIAFWDVRTGLPDSERGEIDIGDQSLREFRVLPDGETIATLGRRLNRQKRAYEQVLQFWKDGQFSKAIKWIEPEGEMKALASTPDGATIATGSSTGELILWDRAAGTRILTQKFPNLRIESIEFSPDGQTLAVAGENGVYLWEWRAGNDPARLAGLPRGARALAFSPDGQLLATGSADAMVARLWDVKTRRLQKALKVNAKWNSPETMAFTSDGRFLAVPTQSQTVELWNVSTGQIEHTFETGNEDPRNVSISPDDRWLIAASYSPVMMVWDLKTREPVVMPPGHEWYVASMAFTPDGKKVVTGSNDRTVRIWNAETGKQEHKLQHDRRVPDVAVSPDGKLVASNSLDDTVRVWDVDSGKQIYRLFGHGEPGRYRAVSFSPDGGKLLSWGDNMAARVWDVRTGKALSDSPIRPSGVKIPEDENGDAVVGEIDGDFFVHLRGGMFTPDGQRFVLTWDQSVFVFDAATGKELQALKIESPLWDVASVCGDHLLATIVDVGEAETVDLADGRQAFSSTQQYDLQICSAQTGDVQRELRLPFGWFHRRPVFSPDEKLIAVASNDADDGIHLFDAESGRLRYLIDGLPATVSAMAFSPDGSRLASAFNNTTVLIWDLAEFRVDSE